MTYTSAQCPQILPNVVRGQILDFFRYVYAFKMAVAIAFHWENAVEAI